MSESIPISNNSGEDESIERKPLKSRTEKPSIYPDRFPVTEEQASWDIPYPEYKPDYFVADVVIEYDSTQKEGGWAEPEEIDATVPRDFFSSYDIKLDEKGRPLNPMGRCGIEGRGLLGKWGPNFAADPIITRKNPNTGELEMVAIRRKDNGQWAIPGGMVDEGEMISETVEREFREEAGAELDMSDAKELYRGYVDDPRNTDNAWIETVVMHKHLSPDDAIKLTLNAGDDADAAQWFPLNEDTISSLYASHADYVRTAVAGLL